MRLIFVFILLVSTAVYAQPPKLFEINKLDSIDFKKFIAEKKVIFVGEMHGTTEVPLFVLQLIQQLQEDEKNLTMGLEIPINHQRDIDEFMKTGDFDKLLKLDYFKYPDGRTSVAMGQLIKGLRSIKRLKVICFDIETSLGREVNRDSLMGINLSNGYREGKLIILTGNLHANLQAGYWRPNFKSAIFHFNRINRFDDKLISLNTYFGSGTIWNCMQNECKERDVFSASILKETYGLTNFLGIYQQAEHSSGYSGFVYFDKVTASKPLVN